MRIFQFLEMLVLDVGGLFFFFFVWVSCSFPLPSKSLDNLSRSVFHTCNAGILHSCGNLGYPSNTWNHVRIATKQKICLLGLLLAHSAALGE